MHISEDSGVSCVVDSFALALNDNSRRLSSGRGVDCLNYIKLDTAKFYAPPNI